MELVLSLGEAFSSKEMDKTSKSSRKGLGFCIGLGIGLDGRDKEEQQEQEQVQDEEEERETGVCSDLPVQLNLLPLVPVPRYPSSQLGFPWTSEKGNSEAGCSDQIASNNRGFDVNQLPSAEEIDDGAAVSSPNSTVSSFQMDFSIYRGNKRDQDAMANDIETERASSRASDEEENGLTRKKLRLSKEQSAYLEESFKEHNTLNPKQKLALAKQLNLRPRQIEVWFQNRRARTKLKQTEVDCEYLKRCCETLTEENRRLQKELQELRALKTSHPFYMQLPATTLTMCPSCERVATTDNTNKTGGFGYSKPRFYPFSQHQSAAS